MAAFSFQFFTSGSVKIEFNFVFSFSLFISFGFCFLPSNCVRFSVFRIQAVSFDPPPSPLIPPPPASPPSLSPPPLACIFSRAANLRYHSSHVERNY